MARVTSPNRRQRIIEFTTPKVADLVVIETKDASKNISSATVADDTPYGTAHPDSTNFPNHKLALIKSANDQNGQYQLWYYVVDRANQDQYNWEFQAAGASSTRYDSVTRTYVILRSSYDESNPALNSSMPTTTSDPFSSSDGYILFEKKQVRSGNEVLDSLYVIEQRVFVKKVPIRNVYVDSTFAFDTTAAGAVQNPSLGGLVDKETIFFYSENIQATTAFSTSGDTLVDTSTTTADSFKEGDLSYATGHSDLGNSNFWGTDKLGVKRVGKQISDNWYVLSEKQVVPSVVTSGDSAGTSVIAKYETQERYVWPPVLNGAAQIGENNGGIVGFTWKLKDGGGETTVLPVYKRNRYDGPTKTEYEITWSKSKQTLTQLNPMHPLPVVFSTPLASLKVQPTLHNAIYAGITSGTNHPKYKYSVSVFDCPATNYIDWPSSLVVSDTQEPNRGGYIRIKKTVYPPNIQAYSGAYAS
jgi:hypothetical protein